MLATEDVSTFSRVITQWRLLRGLSQEQLGEFVGRSQRHISFIENGKTKPGRETVIRLIQAMSIPLQDGNRLLNLLGYSDSLASGVDPSASVKTNLDLLQTAWLSGMHPMAACIADADYRLIKLNLACAVWMSQVAEIDDVFDRGCLSWSSVIFHPDGFRKFVKNWEEVAAAYLQIVNREILRNPATGERALNRIRRLYDVPRSWRVLSDQYAGTVSMPMDVETNLGVLSFRFMSLLVSAPVAQPELEIVDFTIGSLIPIETKGLEQFAALVSHAGPDDIHPKLRTALVCE